MNDFNVFAPKYPISAEFGYTFSRHCLLMPQPGYVTDDLNKFYIR